jgi:hypothetical protein
MAVMASIRTHTRPRGRARAAAVRQSGAAAVGGQAQLAGLSELRRPHEDVAHLGVMPPAAIALYIAEARRYLASVVADGRAHGRDGYDADRNRRTGGRCIQL